MDTALLSQDRLSALERRLGLLLRSQPFAVSWRVVPIGRVGLNGGAVATQSVGAGALPIVGGALTGNWQGPVHPPSHRQAV